MLSLHWFTYSNICWDKSFSQCVKVYSQSCSCTFDNHIRIMTWFYFFPPQMEILIGSHGVAYKIGNLIESFDKPSNF